MALLAVYLGETDESKIDGMSIPFFNNVLAALGKRVNYDAVVNYAGNAFAKDSWKMIQEANPMTKPKKIGNAFAELINKSIKIGKASDFSDFSWAEEPMPGKEFGDGQS